MDQKWAAVLRALDNACFALRAAGWPEPRRYERQPGHMVGYSRERGRRPIVKEAPE